MVVMIAVEMVMEVMMVVVDLDLRKGVAGLEGRKRKEGRKEGRKDIKEGYQGRKDGKRGRKESHQG
jgi:hypothetical protein